MPLERKRRVLGRALRMSLLIIVRTLRIKMDLFFNNGYALCVSSLWEPRAFPHLRYEKFGRLLIYR